MLLSLTLAALTATATPVAGQNARASSHRVVKRGGHEFVQIRTQDKLELGATYYAPKSKRGKQPAALLVHDAGADSRQVEDMAEYLQKKGFGVLILDLRGHGTNATDNLNWSAVDEKGRESLWSFAMRDLRAGADFLREQEEIHASNLSVIGVGAGCALAVRHALDNENARAVVLVAPASENYGFDLANGVGELEGLPTMIIASSDGRNAAQRLQAAGNARSATPFIGLSVMKSKDAGLLQDTRLRSEIATWLRGTVMPKK